MIMSLRIIIMCVVYYDDVRCSVEISMIKHILQTHALCYNNCSKIYYIIFYKDIYYVLSIENQHCPQRSLIQHIAPASSRNSTRKTRSTRNEFNGASMDIWLIFPHVLGTMLGKAQWPKIKQTRDKVYQKHQSRS